MFVPPPAPAEPNEQLPATLRRLIGKFDPVERDRRNRSLGRAGEEFVLELERHQLPSHQDLSRKVRWIADEEGDGAGYDVLSFAPTGRERLLEVKTTNGSARTPFFLSRNELEVSKERQENWRIYRVHLFATSAPHLHAGTPIGRLAATAAGAVEGFVLEDAISCRTRLNRALHPRILPDSAVYAIFCSVPPEPARFSCDLYPP